MAKAGPTVKRGELELHDLVIAAGGWGRPRRSGK